MNAQLASAAGSTLATGAPTELGPLAERAKRGVQLRALETEIRATPALANSTFMIIQAPRSPRS